MKLRSEKLQRITAMSVSALLAANAAVLVTGLADELDDEPTAGDPETVTYIVADDGSRVAVDPSSPEGWRAIADAQDDGREVVTVAEADAPESVRRSSSSSTSTSTTTTTRPRSAVTPSGSQITVPGVDDVDELIDSTVTTLVDTIDEVEDIVDDTVDTVTDVVDDTTGLDTGGTVDPVVDGVTDTVTDTVDTVVDVVTEQSVPSLSDVTVPPLPGL